MPTYFAMNKTVYGSSFDSKRVIYDVYISMQYTNLISSYYICKNKIVIT